MGPQPQRRVKLRRKLAVLASTTALVGVMPVVGLVSPITALAQDAAAEEGSFIEEIVVIARRREETLQKVPEAITVFTAQQIEDGRIEQITDFIAHTPNVEIFYGQQPGVFQMTVRGITQANQAEAPVTMVVDGVTLPYPNSFSKALFDIEQIEVLRGPQGALYGQNAIAGAINIVTKQPTNEFRGRIKGRAGRGGDYRASASLSGPLVKDRILFRVGGFYQDFDGLIESAFMPGFDQDFQESAGFRAELKFLPSDRFTADVSLFYEDADWGGSPLVPRSLSQGSMIPFVDTATLNSNIVVGRPSQDIPTLTSREVYGGSLKLELETGFATLTSITAWEALEEHLQQDLDLSNISFIELTDQATDNEGFTQEIRIVSPGDRRLRWIVGGFYQSLDRQIDDFIGLNLNLVTAADPSPANKFIVPFVENLEDQNHDSSAAFAQFNYDITEQLELTLAARYDRAERSQHNEGFNPGGPFTSDLGTVFEEFLPKATLAYAWREGALVYATFSKGFRPGGFNSGQSIMVGDAFDAEKTTNFEIGFKTSFIDNRVTFNGAVFYTDYENQQIQLVQITPSGAAEGTFTIDKTSVIGFEFELRARPAVGFDLTAGLGFQDAEIDKFGENLGSAVDPTAFEGNRVPRVSKFNFSAAAQYQRPVMNDIDAFMRIDFYHKGTLYWFPDNIDKQKPYSLVDLQIGLRGEKWALMAYGENIFGEEYDILFFDTFFTGTPMQFNFANRSFKPTYGLEASFSF